MVNSIEHAASLLWLQLKSRTFRQLFKLHVVLLVSERINFHAVVCGSWFTIIVFLLPFHIVIMVNMASGPSDPLIPSYYHSGI